MKVEYIYRSPSDAVSIEKCFDSIINNISEREGYIISKSFLKKFKFWPVGLLYNIIRYSLKSRQKKIFHITGDIQYVACLMNSDNTILTIHDLVGLHNPEMSKCFRIILYYLWYYFPLKRLKYICCISEFTKRDLIEHFPFAKDKITVIPSPVSDIFGHFPKDFNAIRPRILHVGTRSNKNLERVIQALNGIPCCLSIVGVLSEKQKELLIVNNIDAKVSSNLSDEEMIKEYQSADIISFPSLFEGFGLPVIEGQVVGRPVLTSILEPMRTVAGPNSILVDPESVDSIRNGFLTIINDKEKRDLCVESGLVNAKKFTTNFVVDEYCKIYNKML